VQTGIKSSHHLLSPSIEDNTSLLKRKKPSNFGLLAR